MKPDRDGSKPGISGVARYSSGGMEISHAGVRTVKQYDLPEHREGQLLGSLRPLADAMGVDKFCAMAIQFALPYEQSLREKGMLTEDALELLDEYHAEKCREECGFE